MNTCSILMYIVFYKMQPLLCTIQEFEMFGAMMLKNIYSVPIYIIFLRHDRKGCVANKNAEERILCACVYTQSRHT